MGFYLVLRLGLLLARAFPFRRFSDLCARIGRAVGWLSPARRIVVNNLRTIGSAGGRRVVAGDVFASYGRYWGEFMALAARPLRQSKLSLDVQGLEYLIEARSRGPVCALTAHLASWDVLAHWLARELPDFVFVAERVRPERLFRLFCAMRAALGYPVIPARGGGPELSRHLCSGASTLLVVDRTLGARSREAQLLGGRRQLPSSGMDLAREAGAALLPVFLRREGLSFVVQVHPPLTASEDPVAGFARALESELTEAPEQWCVLYPLHDAAGIVEPALAARKAVAS